MAKNTTIRGLGKRALAVFLSLVMVTSLLNIGALAAGTASDPYDVGDIVYTADKNTQPEGVIPSLTKWEYQKTIAAAYDKTAERICGKESHRHGWDCYDWGKIVCGKEEHSHKDSCYPLKEAAKAQWKLVKNEDTALHLDIHIALKATYTLDGTPYTADVTLTKEDYTSGNLKITSTADFKISGTEIYDEGQRRFNGTFPVGTSDDPVYYTIELTKNVDFNVKGETVSVPMTFEKTVHFWDEDNICETIMGSSDKSKWENGEFIRGGMDFKLGASEATGTTAPAKATLTVQKNVAGIDLAQAKAFTFGVYSGSTLVDTIELTVAAGGTTAIGTTALEVDESYYVVEEGDPAIDGYTLTTKADGKNGTVSDSFTLTGDKKSVEGYTFQKTTGDAVSGTMESDKEVTYVYSKNPVYFTLTVNYIDETGAELAASETETKLEGSAYSTEQKSFEGYTFQKTTGDAVSGTMTSNKEVTYVYSKNPVYYILTVNYVDEASHALTASETDLKLENSDYTTSAKTFEGYTFKETTGNDASGIMDGNKEVTYIYTKNENPPPAPNSYTLTVNHVDETGHALAGAETESKLEGSAYSTSAKTFEGYSFKETTGDAVSGTMTSYKEVTDVYSKTPV